MHYLLPKNNLFKNIFEYTVIFLFKVFDIFLKTVKLFFFPVGFVYGAKENKKLRVFIDDVNLPVMDQFGVQRCNEVRISTATSGDKNISILHLSCIKESSKLHRSR